MFLRSILFASLSIVSHAPAVAQTPTEETYVVELHADQTPKESLSEILLESSEFELLGYDARREILAIRFSINLPANVQRARSLHLKARSALRISLPAEALAQTIEAHQNGQLFLNLRVRPISEAHGEGTLQLSSDTFEVASGKIQLQETQFAILDDIVSPKTAPSVEHLTLKIGPIRAKNHVVPEAKMLLQRAARATQDCVRSTHTPLQRIQGAIFIELQTSLIGEPSQPRIAVDGLLQRTLTHCILDALAKDAALWDDLPPNSNLYLPLYFRPHSTAHSQRLAETQPKESQQVQKPQNHYDLADAALP